MSCGNPCQVERLPLEVVGAFLPVYVQVSGYDAGYVIYPPIC